MCIFHYILFFDLFLRNIEIAIIRIIATIIAITPGQPNTATILLPKDIIIPAKITPSATAEMLVLKSRFKKLAANVPVHAPVPGNGIPTNKSNAQNIPLFPADALKFSYYFFVFSPFKDFSCK